MIGSASRRWQWRPLSSFRRRCALENIPKRARELALLLAELAGTDPEVGEGLSVAPSLDYLADALGIDRSNLLRRRGLLEKAGLVIIEPPAPGTRTKVWRLVHDLDRSVSKSSSFDTDDAVTRSVSKSTETNTDGQPGAEVCDSVDSEPPSVSKWRSDSVAHARAQPRNQETESGDEVEAEILRSDSAPAVPGAGPDSKPEDPADQQQDGLGEMSGCGEIEPGPAALKLMDVGVPRIIAIDAETILLTRHYPSVEWMWDRLRVRIDPDEPWRSAVARAVVQHCHALMARAEARQRSGDRTP